MTDGWPRPRGRAFLGRKALPWTQNFRRFSVFDECVCSDNKIASLTGPIRFRYLWLQTVNLRFVFFSHHDVHRESQPCLRGMTGLSCDRFEFAHCG